jgi:L-asparagine transporter-like permease
MGDAPAGDGRSPADGPSRSSLGTRVRRLFLGRPRDLGDSSLFHRLSLIPLLAWVGLGADGLSSSCYGPEEAFRTLGAHTYLALALALATAATVFVISFAYSRIIEEFPNGGGYVVAMKLLGERVGVVSGCALLVDYVLTITVSIAAAVDALFSFLPFDPSWKVPIECGLIVLLIVLNMRGVRESVLALIPIFIVFVVTHLILIGGGIVLKLPEVGATARTIGGGLQDGVSTVGAWGVILLFLHAYSLGSGTYTGIEAVSNAVPIMREPRVESAKRTMVYMASSLAFTAGGLILCYLLWKVAYVPNQTMNAALARQFVGTVPGGTVFVIVTLLAEGALLVVGAQAGFIGGPRVLANLATDSWVPRRFGALSERLTTQNGIALMGAAAIAALFYTRGDVRALVIMYSINVFLTFSLSMFGMARKWWRTPGRGRQRRRRLALFGGALALCATILVITVAEKFLEGGWLTLCVTGGLVLVCFLIRRHYRGVARALGSLYASLEDIPLSAEPAQAPVDPRGRTAAFLVAGYGGLGIHTVLNSLRMFEGGFKNIVFLSVAVIDSGVFKGADEIEALKAKTGETLRKYEELGRGLGIPSTSRFALGTDVVAEAEKLCLEVARDFSRTTFFLGKITFAREAWYHRWLHNETAFAVQKRLELAGKPIVVMPARLQ